MHIRVATEQDAGLLAPLNRHVHDLHVRAEPDRYCATRLEEVEQRFGASLADPRVHVRVAEIAGAVAGYVIAQEVRQPAQAFSPQREFLLVDQLAVVPEFRRNGVGRALMEACTQIARDNGLPRVELNVRSHNEGAQEFYASVGYGPVQTRLARDV